MSETYFALRCGSCGEIFTEDCDPPAYDAGADSQSDAMGVECIDTECPHCETEVSITIRAVTYDIFEAWRNDNGFVHFSSPPSIEDEEQYESYLEEAKPNDPYRFFVRSTSGLHDLRRVNTESTRVTQAQYRMIYANQIAILEAYLADRLISLVTRSDNNFVKFVNDHDKLKKQTIGLHTALGDPGHARKVVIDYLKNTLYHNLTTVEQLYKDAFGIDVFPDAAVRKSLEGAIHVRHDLVHRNGISKSGVVTTIAPSEVDGVSRLVSKVVRDIEAELTHEIRELEFYRHEPRSTDSS